jgi:DNA helicase-2/ATP-dependent DNA helicase PcrA
MKEQKKNKPSKYQEAVYLATLTTNKHISIKACPGSGKTTTIVEASKLVPYTKKALFQAFNKSIVIELKKKLPPNVDCSTMHSMGCKAIFAHYPGEKKIEKDKQIRFIQPYYKEKPPREKWSAIFTVDRIMSLARATMTPPIREEIEKMANNYALDAEDGHINIACKALKKFYEYNDDPDLWNIDIDFQDMIEMCVRNTEIKLPVYDYVFIDEAQDLSRLDQIFTKRLVKQGTGRKIVVGDPKQSIYGFRGSDPNSFESFVNEPNTIQLPLSICYRSTKAIVRNAQTVYPDIEVFEENEEGIEPRKGKLEDVQEGDMVLCRNTRPLIIAFLQLVTDGKKAYVVGKEMEKGLLALLAPFESSAKTMDVRLDLQKHLEKVSENLKAKGILKPQNHPKYVQIEEKLQILYLLFDKFNHIFEIEEFIELIFEDDDREGIRLMTIHKSKGLENDRVFVIESSDGKNLIPSSYAVTPDQLRQEKNLLFVAVTRAKKELVYLNL